MLRQPGIRATHTSSLRTRLFDSRQKCDHQTWQKHTRKSLLRRQMHTGKLSRHLGIGFLNQARFHPGRGKPGCISRLRAALGCGHVASHRTCDQKLVGAAGQHRDHHTGSRLPEVRTLLSRSAMPFSKVTLGHAAVSAHMCYKEACPPVVVFGMRVLGAVPSLQSRRVCLLVLK